MYILFENLTRKQADTCALVLSSAGLAYKVLRDKTSGWGVWVKESQYDQALDVMNRYFSENRPVFPPRTSKTSVVTTGMLISGMIACIIILASQLWVNASGDVRETVNRFGASASHILDGEYYRVVTALMLHSDDVHLAGNMAGLFIFGTAVCAVTGWGVGWLMILMCGACGNLVNALMYESAHVSIGASTAVFGAIGILTGYQIVSHSRTSVKFGAAWIPLACGLALLGMLGSTGEHVDIMAHLFGFSCGLAAGLCYALVFKGLPGRIVQWIAVFAVTGIIFFSWSAG
ncbi:MAG: rhomboid family intramembrane serine protease [Desulfobacteraceae bacterium]|nr:MAG: rhomboid family intramembrane serine protease [Desulfobacteraceae bacterium]